MTSPLPLPSAGGSYLRQKDGSLLRVDDRPADPTPSDAPSEPVEETGTPPAATPPEASKKKGA